MAESSKIESPGTAAGAAIICLRGINTHNLQNVDVELPRGKLICVCGKSGSGKTSLVIHTLYAEGRRRYVETLSARTRQALQELPKPQVEHVDGMVPAIRIDWATNRSPLATVGTETDIAEYLRTLLAQIGVVVCPGCQQHVSRHDPLTICGEIDELPKGLRMLVTFPVSKVSGHRDPLSPHEFASEGFRRAIVGNHMFDLSDDSLPQSHDHPACDIVVDRLVSGRADASRVQESVETALSFGAGRCAIYAHSPPDALSATHETRWQPVNIDDTTYLHRTFADHLYCSACQQRYIDPSPQLLNPRSPLGACPNCEGQSVTTATGGDRTSAPCPACQGSGLNELVLAIKLAGRDMVQWSSLSANDFAAELEELQLAQLQRRIAQPLIDAASRRARKLCELGLSGLALNRPLAMLSHGQRRRVALVVPLCCSLVDALYLLDEPSGGLHADDIATICAALRQLQAHGNTVVCADNARQLIDASDHVIELGPGAGAKGGNIVFEGTPKQLLAQDGSPTGDWLSGRRGSQPSTSRRSPQRTLRLVKATGWNLQSVSVEFPLGVLCVVTGASGSGKSALVEHTLFRAVAQQLGEKAPQPLPHEDLIGATQLDHAVLLDREPVLGNRRSNVATYVKAFDAIRNVFAETVDAKTRNYSASHFSFNVRGGRCEHCTGEGSLTVDMQFLDDMTVACPECHGARFRREILDVHYRNRSIADVLAMTVREAFSFFRGQQAVQSRLKYLLDVGLDYICLGQSVATLSGGETQRLRLASLVQSNRKGRTLFIIDEPTEGLHPSDILPILDCFDALLSVGHSIIDICQDAQVQAHADHVIELKHGKIVQGNCPTTRN